ncbi:phosphotransferase [Kribbella sandramycini]|uniref:phosphotransferase n=1 Tax=Kribbella sandramycini TaxID=60450 RepID=UPI0031CE6138
MTVVREGRATDGTWRAVGRAFQRLHAIPASDLPAGMVEPAPADRVQALHEQLAVDERYLAEHLPAVVPGLPRVHALIDELAAELRHPAVLLHFDVNPANIIVSADSAQ